ncbi:hypothetical protein [Microbacterium sp. A1-JK]|uniref:hypothetical protein n=1 Tax=Microbacterium sp. A1-JK TaxID=3177516 RepID=UPI00388B23CB
MEDRSRGDIPRDTPFLQEALDAASTRIRNRCEWHIFPEISELGYRLRARQGVSTWLPTAHLVTIDSLTTQAGADVDVESLQWWRDGHVEGIPSTGISIMNFTHGYEEAPADLVALCLALTVGDLVARGVLREQTLTSSITWDRASGALTQADKADLMAYMIGYQP